MYFKNISRGSGCPVAKAIVQTRTRRSQISPSNSPGAKTLGSFNKTLKKHKRKIKLSWWDDPHQPRWAFRNKKLNNSHSIEFAKFKRMWWAGIFELYFLNSWVKHLFLEFRFVIHKNPFRAWIIFVKFKNKEEDFIFMNSTRAKISEAFSGLSLFSFIFNTQTIFSKQNWEMVRCCLTREAAHITRKTKAHVRILHILLAISSSS